MFARALIVLLVVLNLGVAVWWMTVDDPPPVPSTTTGAGVARLQLLREMPRKPAPDAAASPSVAMTATPLANAAAATPATDAAAVVTPLETTPVAAQRCYALGPFADAAKADIARSKLLPQASRLHVRRVAAKPASGWRVWLPPLADRAAAQAVAARIVAAGFKDYFIVSNGDEANSIALGRYGSEPSARQHEAALHAAGFADVRAQPLGVSGAEQTWIDVAVPAASDIAGQRRALGAARADPVDCKTVP